MEKHHKNINTHYSLVLSGAILIQLMEDYISQSESKDNMKRQQSAHTSHLGIHQSVCVFTATLLFNVPEEEYPVYVRT